DHESNTTKGAGHGETRGGRRDAVLYVRGRGTFVFVLTMDPLSGSQVRPPNALRQRCAPSLPQGRVGRLDDAGGTDDGSRGRRGAGGLNVTYPSTHWRRGVMVPRRHHGDGENNDCLLFLADRRSAEGRESLEALLKAAGGRASAEPLAGGLVLVRYLPGVNSGGRRGRG
ncbi:MAG: hypothetical protein M3R38_20360, partial [Actinomycetota bacterium]|nr:hypothetical protein [Actinomycetota bacterium]